MKGVIMIERIEALAEGRLMILRANSSRTIPADEKYIEPATFKGLKEDERKFLVDGDGDPYDSGNKNNLACDWYLTRESAIGYLALKNPGQFQK